MTGGPTDQETALAPKMVFVVAWSEKEARGLAKLIGHSTRKEALAHLAEVRNPPTDPAYAALYKVYEVPNV